MSSSPKPAPKKSGVMNTGIKVEGRSVFFTKGLKNPLSGFFFKTADGKKNKILVKNVTNKSTKDALESILKNHANAVTPPAGKVLNPLTGRFVKDPDAKKIPKIARNYNNSNNEYDNEERRELKKWRKIQGKSKRANLKFDTLAEFENLVGD